MDESSQTALRERILTAYRQLEREHRLPLSTELRLQLLSRHTGIDRLRLDPIAAPLLERQARNRCRNQKLLGLLLLLCLALLLFNIYREEAGHTPALVDHQVYLTHALQRIGDTSLPVDRLERVRLADGRFYLYQRLLLVPSSTPRQTRLRLYDSQRRQVTECIYRFTPTSGQWNTWCPYTPNPARDPVGGWRYEILLDQETIDTGSFHVVP